MMSMIQSIPAQRNTERAYIFSSKIQIDFRLARILSLTLLTNSKTSSKISIRYFEIDCEEYDLIIHFYAQSLIPENSLIFKRDTGK